MIGPDMGRSIMSAAVYVYFQTCDHGFDVIFHAKVSRLFILEEGHSKVIQR